MTKERRTTLIRFSLLVGTVASLFFVPWLLLKAWLLPLPSTLQQQLDEAVSHGFDGVVVYIDQAGKVPVSLASGMHNRDQGIAAQADALFKIASIKKLYDAVAVSKLVHAGILSLEKPLAGYLPELLGRIQHAEQITLRMLVQHRSGIPNFTDAPGFWANPTQSYAQSLALIIDQPANFLPDQGYEYSNTNYLLIDKIIQDALGYAAFEFVQAQILDRLNLHNTYASLADVNMDEVMSGYHVGHPFDLKADEHGMLASAEDVAIFLRALNDGSLFDGTEQDIYSDLYQYEHSGWVPGYQSFANYDKKLDAVIIQFYSTTDSELYNWNLAEIINARLLKILRNP